MSHGPLLMVLVVLNQIISMQVLNWLPGIVTVRIAPPFDQILQLLLATKISMHEDCFDFPFFFSLNEVRRGSHIIRTVCLSLDIGREE